MDKVIETKSQMIMRIAELSEANERLERQYEDVLKLAKENADSNEYCLQELEQENEKLKQVANDSIIEQEKLIAKVNELEQENERLKEEFSSYEDDIEDWVSDNSILYQYDDKTPNTLEELQACMESSHEQWQKYKQALQEIREYCEEQNLKADYTACEVIRRIEEVIGVK